MKQNNYIEHFIKTLNTCDIIKANPCLLINSNANVMSVLRVLNFCRATVFSSIVPLLSLDRISLAVLEGDNSNLRILPFFTSLRFFSVI